MRHPRHLEDLVRVVVEHVQPAVEAANVVLRWVVRAPMGEVRYAGSGDREIAVMMAELVEIII